jgi:hypothetical protein
MARKTAYERTCPGCSAAELSSYSIEITAEPTSNNSAFLYCVRILAERSSDNVSEEGPILMPDRIDGNV